MLLSKSHGILAYVLPFDPLGQSRKIEQLS